MSKPKETRQRWRYEEATQTIRTVPGNHWVCTMDSWDGALDHEGNAIKAAAAPQLLEALQDLLERYTSLVNCGDCGNWDAEKETEVQSARKAIAAATERA